VESPPALERCARHLEILLSAIALGEIVFSSRFPEDLVADTNATLAHMTSDVEVVFRDLNLQPLPFSILNLEGRVQ